MNHKLVQGSFGPQGKLGFLVAEFKSHPKSVNFGSIGVIVSQKVKSVLIHPLRFLGLRPVSYNSTCRR